MFFLIVLKKISSSCFTTNEGNLLKKNEIWSTFRRRWPHFSSLRTVIECTRSSYAPDRWFPTSLRSQSNASKSSPNRSLIHPPPSVRNPRPQNTQPTRPHPVGSSSISIVYTTFDSAANKEARYVGVTRTEPPNSTRSKSYANLPWKWIDLTATTWRCNLCADVTKCHRRVIAGCLISLAWGIFFSSSSSWNRNLIWLNHLAYDFTRSGDCLHAWTRYSCIMSPFGQQRPVGMLPLPASK